jgi:hypothetical protein
MARVAIEPPQKVINEADWVRADAAPTPPVPAGQPGSDRMAAPSPRRASTYDQKSLRWQQVVARSWSDPAFKQRLLNDPVETLRAEGLEVPEGRRVKVVEQTGTLDFLILPAKASEELEGFELGG